ncbi:MAG: lytic transglycosylase domain-containing protein [Chitinophagaceae bacterium]|nr:lytic transglycosylase domain-containing protein [Chitinophagaceae bacterium]
MNLSTYRYHIGFLLITVVLFLNHSNAATGDTTTLLANNAKTLAPVSEIIITKPSNITYPSLLEKHRQQTIGYVEKISNKKRAYLIHTYNAGQKFFPKISAILKSYQLPPELKVLIALESGFNGNAVSPAGAVGYWQLMDAAAKEHGLKISNGTKVKGKMRQCDERKNLSKSTYAAAKYLREGAANLNDDILLTVASYNCGIGKVRSAMKQSGKSDAGFWDIKKYLPAETRNYVMNFIALNVIFDNYDKFVKNNLVFTPVVQTIKVTEPAEDPIDATL